MQDLIPHRQGRRPWQYRLQTLFLTLLVAGIALGIARNFPTLAMAIGLAATLPSLPLTAVGLVERRWQVSAASPNPRHLTPLGLLLLLPSSTQVGFRRSILIAVSGSLALVGLWPLMRWLGEFVSTWVWMRLHYPEPLTLTEQLKVIVLDRGPSLLRPYYWVRICTWEAWSLLRWWLLFGLITLIWDVVAWYREESGRCLVRLPLLAPWLIVIETLFLVGVWLDGLGVSPEPATLFLVGVFSWDKWHWTCWLDRDWLIRGAVPTFVCGLVYFRCVLRWHWVATMIAAAALIPLALMTSVAWTRLYIDLFNP
jgi:hypothetical protein